MRIDLKSKFLSVGREMLWKLEQKIQRKNQKSKQITAGILNRKIVSLGRKIIGVVLWVKRPQNQT